jgi:putative ABC transport system permease protein
MGVHLLAGRAFTERDRPGAPRVAIVDEVTAHRLWGGKSPLGARLKLDASPRSPLPWIEVVGVVGHVRNDALADTAPMQLYLPSLQAPQPFMDLVVRTGDPTGVASALRWTVTQIDPQQPIDQLTPMERVLADSLSRQRLAAGLLAAFALLALVVTAVGDYAVLAYAVTRKRNEIGVRMAMGARSGDILRWVLRDGLWLTLAGISLGLVLCFTTEHWIARLLHGINPHEPWILALAIAATIVIGLLASYLPARRAARIHPATTLRYE